MAVPGGNPQPLEPLGGKGEGRAVLAKADILEEFESLPAADVQAGLTSQIDFKAGACGPILHCASAVPVDQGDRKSTRLNSSHLVISYAVFCLKKKKIL